MDNVYRPEKGDVVVFFPTPGSEASVGEVVCFYNPQEVKIKKLDQKTKTWYQPMLVPLTQIVQKVTLQ